MQFVMSKWTSCLSSSSSIAPRYPIRLSVNFWEAINFRHSSWKTTPQVTTGHRSDDSGSDSVHTYLAKVSWVSQHVHVQKLCHVSAPVRVVFLSKGRADGSALFLDHLPLLCLGPGRPDGPDQLPQSDRSWHSLEKNMRARVTLRLLIIKIKHS